MNLEDANSTEINSNTDNPIVDLLPGTEGCFRYGGSLRLGANEVIIKSNSNAEKIYQTTKINKRHRHRYEINKEYIPEFEKNGLVFTADSDNGKRMKMLEIPNHKFYLVYNFILSSIVDQEFLKNHFPHSSKHPQKNNLRIIQF